MVFDKILTEAILGTASEAIIATDQAARFTSVTRAPNGFSATQAARRWGNRWTLLSRRSCVSVTGPAIVG